MGTIWVFGYGSLMWQNSEFEPQKIVKAKLIGAHRSYNKKSIESRGTRNRPGLVLGTEPGGECIGIALLIDERFISKLDKREGTTGYTKITTPTQELKVVGDQTLDPCIVYISNPRHSSYAGNLSLKERAQMAINAEPGTRGTSVGYIKDTLDKSLALGINDTPLREMYEEIQRLLSQESHANTHWYSGAITDVEVYDSPGSYGKHSIKNSDLIVGLSKEIRDALGVIGNWEANETVVLHHGMNKITAKIVQTDSRLISNGTCKADNPANHCWLTPFARENLNLKELPQNEWAHRLNYPAFKKKYSSIKITKK